MTVNKQGGPTSFTAAHKIKNVFRACINALKTLTSESLYLAKTYAPIDVLYALFSKYNHRRVFHVKYQAQSLAFEKKKTNLNLSDDWFSGNIPYWLSVIDAYGLRSGDIQVLEIGSWEGLS